MPEYTSTRTVDADAERLFAFLSDVSNLPRYFSAMTEARPGDGESVITTAVIEPPGEQKRTVHGEAWFRIDDAQNQLAWGAEGPNDYRGELAVTSEGSGSKVELTLHTESSRPGVDEGIEETLANIARLVEADVTGA